MPLDIEYSFASHGSLQNAVDTIENAGGGVLRVPSGTYNWSGERIWLPRTDLDGNGPVQIRCAGRGLVRFVPLSSGWNDTCVFGWKPADGDRRRTWNQAITDCTIYLPRADCVGIHYERTEEDEGPAYEKFGDSEFRNLEFRTYNDYEQTCIRLEGNVHDTLFESLSNDAGQDSAANHDAQLLVVDDGPERANAGQHLLDDYGLYNCRLIGLQNTPRRGGYASLFSGRCIAGCSFENMKAGRGSLGTPQIRLVNSNGVRIQSVSTEGYKESPQILIDNCAGVSLSDLLIGTPDAEGGNGIDIVNSTNVRIWNWVSRPRVQTWPLVGTGKKRVTLDADSKNCHVEIDVTDDTFGNVETIDNVTSDLGVDNYVGCSNTVTGYRVARFNRRLVTPTRRAVDLGGRFVANPDYP